MSHNLARHWRKQLNRLGGIIDALEAMEQSGPLLEPDDHRLALRHLRVMRDGIERELGIAPPLSRRP